jgi:uncharacterized protein YeaO (DUF488 family)
MLYTKCILKPPSPEDGFRISVMSRHTTNDGKTPDPRITEELFHVHLSHLGPDPKKIGAYLRKEITWREFASAYRKKLQERPSSTGVEMIAKGALDGNITILCIEETAERCHRRLLAEECKRRFPDLQIEHR